MVLTKHRMAAVAALVVAFAVAISAACVMPAHAVAKENVWVVANASYSDGYDSTKCTFTYNTKGLLVQDKEKCSNGIVEKYNWAYDTKGHYTKYVNTYINSVGDKSTWKYKLTFDKKKRVKSASSDGTSSNTYKIAYNTKGRCKMYGFWQPVFTSAGYLKKLQGTGAGSDRCYSFKRDAKGSIVKATSTTSWSSSELAFENTYENERLASWTGTGSGAGDVSGTITWKMLSVPDKTAAKVRAQQRWIVDKMQFYDSSKLLMVTINK